MAKSSERQELRKVDQIVNQSNIIEDGNPTRYHLRASTDSLNKSEPYKQITFGEKDKNKPHKTILMVGETGTGKTKLINTMVNYMLGVEREDKVWFEITDDQTDQPSFYSQTSILTVYGFYLQESPINLTIIDTPGYGDTRGVEKDQEIAMNLLSLSRCDDLVHKVDAVCLVIKATQNRLSDRQIYIFDAVQSLFGNNIDENIVLLLTYSRGAYPTVVLTAVKEAEIRCAVNDKNQPVYFMFDNCQGETFHEEFQMVQEHSWNLSLREITGFFTFLNNIKPKTLKMTRDVLCQRKLLEAKIPNIQSHIQETERKQNELKQTRRALDEHKKVVKENETFEYEVEISYKEKIDIDLSKASVAICCTICKENCHYPGCWWVTGLSWCSKMKDDKCTVCTKKCHYSKHVKEAKIYITKTKREKRTNEDSKKKYNDNIMKIRNNESEIKKLEKELQELEKNKIKLVIDTFHCVEALEMIALNTDSVLTLLHIDYLIEKLLEINETEKVETLENIKGRAGEEKRRAMRYIKKEG